MCDESDDFIDIRFRVQYLDFVLASTDPDSSLYQAALKHQKAEIHSGAYYWIATL